MPSKDKIAVKMNGKVDVLERHKAMIDALIRFVKKHPKTTHKAAVKGLAGGKSGISFPDYALIVPYWNGGDIELRLVKSGEDWLNSLDSDAFIDLEKLVADDVSEISSEDLQKMLDEMYHEANPDADEKEEE